jgi:small-conductance mechanosensitive channel
MRLDDTVFGTVQVYQLLYFLLILVFASILSRVTNRYIQRNFKEKLSPDHLQLISKLISYGFLATSGLFAIPLLGMKLSGFVVAGSVVGVVLGFASQNVVSNFISGLFIILETKLINVLVNTLMLGIRT